MRATLPVLVFRHRRLGMGLDSPHVQMVAHRHHSPPRLRWFARRDQRSQANRLQLGRSPRGRGSGKLPGAVEYRRLPLAGSSCDNAPHHDPRHCRAVHPYQAPPTSRRFAPLPQVLLCAGWCPHTHMLPGVRHRSGPPPPHHRSFHSASNVLATHILAAVWARLRRAARLACRPCKRGRGMAPHCFARGHRLREAASDPLDPAPRSTVDGHHTGRSRFRQDSRDPSSIKFRPPAPFIQPRPTNRHTSEQWRKDGGDRSHNRTRRYLTDRTRQPNRPVRPAPDQLARRRGMGRCRERIRPAGKRTPGGRRPRSLVYSHRKTHTNQSTPCTGWRPLNEVDQAAIKRARCDSRNDAAPSSRSTTPRTEN